MARTIAGGSMKWLGIFVTIAAALMVAFPSVTVRYRLTLDCESDGRSVSGSGVIQVDYGTLVPWLTNRSGGITIAVYGDAVTLDLGARGVLFALQKEGTHSRSGPEYIVPLAYAVSGYGAGLSNLSVGVG